MRFFWTCSCADLAYTVHKHDPSVEGFVQGSGSLATFKLSLSILSVADLSLSLFLYSLFLCKPSPLESSIVPSIVTRILQNDDYNQSNELRKDHAYAVCLLRRLPHHIVPIVHTSSVRYGWYGLY